MVRADMSSPSDAHTRTDSLGVPHGDAGRAPARPGEGRVVAVLGPTNTGKTHYAIERMLGHASGMIGLPLRLLAREIYDRVVERIGAGQVALITGEEKIVPASPRYFVCTVESMPVGRRVDFLAVDEIQLSADPERGHVFTDRLLHARGDQETLFLGSDTMRGVLRQLLPRATFQSRPRYSDLTYVGPKKLSRLPRRSAVVAFSAEAVYGLAELIRRQRGGAAVVMGALSPRTRNAQVALYQSGDVDFLVATDAIGMGLNMDVDHVAFASVSKFDGAVMRPLKPIEVAQIAGRAGRFLNDGTFGPTGDVPPLDRALVEQVEQHRFDPVRVIQWRNAELDFSSFAALVASLEVPPPAKGLARARNAEDLLVLKTLGEDVDVTALTNSSVGLRRLWEVAQVPDFRKVSLDQHARMLAQIYAHLMSAGERLPMDWVAEQVARIDVTAGDLDTLSQRLAQIRTWTYISQRSDWLADPAYWQERTRAIEDALSDALHEALTERFIDRRTSVLMKRLTQDEDLTATVAGDGEVLVEGEYVGRLNGFEFAPDPRGASSELGPKTLRYAASRALVPEISMRAQRLSNVPDASLHLSEHGKIWWEGSAIARLVAGADALAPRVQLIADEILAGALREKVQSRLETWVKLHIEKILAPLVTLKQAQDLEGLARGLAFQLIETLGSLPRGEVADAVRGLDQPSRAALRRYGVRFGAHSVFIPLLLKPAAAQLKLLLWEVQQAGMLQGLRLPAPPGPGLVSVPVEPNAPPLFYERAGFRLCGARAVRLDMLERLADLLRPPRPVASTQPVVPAAEAAIITEPTPEPAPEGIEATPVVDEAPLSEPAPEQETTASEVSEPPTVSPAVVPEPKALRVAPDGSFEVGPDMMSIVGCSGDEFESLLRALNFRQVRRRDEATGAEVLRWRPQRRRDAERGTQSRGPQTRGPRAPRPTPEGEVSEGARVRRLDTRRRRDEEPKPEGAPGKAEQDGPRRERGPKEHHHAGKRPDKRGDKRPDHRNKDDRRPRPDSPDRRTEAPDRRRDRPYDPDSPFAALAALKQTLAKRN